MTLEQPRLGSNPPNESGQERGATLGVDPVGHSDSHALRRSHRVTTLPSHLRDFNCFSTLASL